MTDINTIQKSFKDKSLFDQALTHRSWVNEHPNKRGTNERLEFLGDAILEFIVSVELYKQFKKKEEGYLTALRANLVNTTNLAQAAKKLNLGKHLFLSKGEEETGGRDNPSLLADTMEAVIGAIYLDSGLTKTKEFINKYVLVDIQTIIRKPLKDSKSRLQEMVQAKSMSAPNYKIISESGPDHSKKFIVEVIVEGKRLGKGRGKTKSEAEQKAAEATLRDDSL